MTRLEELKAAFDVADAAYDAARADFHAAASRADEAEHAQDVAAYEAAHAARLANAAKTNYQAELEKTKEKTND
tara:strand:- start:325 stop:546 length:222 start_codon:yes stop_codon:yes gene_type:complete